MQTFRTRPILSLSYNRSDSFVGKVVKATINLPPLAEEHAESRQMAEDCEKVMTSDVEGDEWELEQARINWCAERYWSRLRNATKNNWA